MLKPGLCVLCGSKSGFNGRTLHEIIEGEETHPHKEPGNDPKDSSPVSVVQKRRLGWDCCQCTDSRLEQSV